MSHAHQKYCQNCKARESTRCYEALSTMCVRIRISGGVCRVTYNHARNVCAVVGQVRRAVHEHLMVHVAEGVWQQFTTCVKRAQGKSGALRRGGRTVKASTSWRLDASLLRRIHVGPLA